MMRARLIFCVYILAALAGGLLYRTSYAVDEMQTRLSQLNRSIVAEQENIQVLGAEWTYLSEPHRIETLAAKYLNMESTKPQRVASLRDMSRLVALKDAEPAVAAPVAAAPVAVAAAKPVVVAPVAQPKLQLASATTSVTNTFQAKTTAKPVQKQSAAAVVTATQSRSTATPNSVKLLLASFQPSKVLTRE